MSITGIVIAAALVGGTGLLIGIALGFAGKVFEVEVDEKEIKVRECLPGNNCGGCGYAGCDGLAKAIAAGEAPVNGCPVGGADAAAAIGEIMGQSAEVVPMVAFVKCAGDCDSASNKYPYKGSMSCREAAVVSQGPKGCSFGCMGYGSCVEVCEFGALSIQNGIAVVDEELCVACGKCAKVCPKQLIDIVPKDSLYRVQCASKEKGKFVKAVCKKGCIGCKMCEKICPIDAITVENDIATVDYDKCLYCGACAAKCPSKIILEREMKK